MTDFNFLSEGGFLRVKAMHRLQTVLQREKKGYVKVLHARCGVGLTVEQFDYIVKGLVDQGWCSVKVGGHGGTMVVFNEQLNNVNVPDAPEEVAQ